jgi:hypothetical protein
VEAEKGAIQQNALDGVVVKADIFLFFFNHYREPCHTQEGLNKARQAG